MLLFSLFFSLVQPVYAEDIVATVNNVNITKGEFEQAYQQNKLFVSDRIVSKEKVLDDLINRIVGIQKAKAAKLNDDPTVKSKMEDVLYHAQISKDLESVLAKITVSDSEVKEYYKDFPEYRTAHILLRVRAEPDANEVKAAQETSLDLYKKLKETPGKFSEFAGRYSQSTLSSNGGDIGFQPAVRMAPEYFKAIKDKEKDYITSPVRSQFGYHIIKVIAKKDYKDINLDLYKKIVYDSKRDIILEEYFENLRKSASIKIEKKYLQ